MWSTYRASDHSPSAHSIERDATWPTISTKSIQTGAGVNIRIPAALERPHKQFEAFYAKGPLVWPSTEYWQQVILPSYRIYCGGVNSIANINKFARALSRAWPEYKAATTATATSTQSEDTDDEDAPFLSGFLTLVRYAQMANSSLIQQLAIYAICAVLNTDGIDASVRTRLESFAIIQRTEYLDSVATARATKTHAGNACWVWPALDACAHLLRSAVAINPQSTAFAKWFSWQLSQCSFVALYLLECSQRDEAHTTGGMSAAERAREQESIEFLKTENARRFVMAHIKLESIDFVKLLANTTLVETWRSMPKELQLNHLKNLLVARLQAVPFGPVPFPASKLLPETQIRYAAWERIFPLSPISSMTALDLYASQNVVDGMQMDSESGFELLGSIKKRPQVPAPRDVINLVSDDEDDAGYNDFNDDKSADVSAYDAKLDGFHYTPPSENAQRLDDLRISQFAEYRNSDSRSMPLEQPDEELPYFVTTSNNGQPPDIESSLLASSLPSDFYLPDLAVDDTTRSNISRTYMYQYMQEARQNLK